MSLLLLLLLLGLNLGETGGEEAYKAAAIESPTIWAQMDSAYLLQPCNRSREIIENSMKGRISDGPFNYTQDTTCEWLIKAPPGHWISLRIDRVRTECSYDYLFVVDGSSYQPGESRMLASFSGASDPHVNLLAQSGNMLILLYSDPNYVLEGFQAEYSISPCPLNCSNAGECQSRTEGDGAGNVCKCEAFRGGVACEKTLKNNNSSAAAHLQSSSTSENDNQSVVIASSWNSPLARVGHSMIRIGDQVYIYGGYDLNLVLDDLISHNLSTNQTIILGNASKSPSWPVARYAHASVKYGNGFFIHGGKTSRGEITNDLFYYNVSNNELFGFSSSLLLPHLMYHTMGSTPSGDIYVFGGGSPRGEFSSRLYKFAGSAPTKWSLVDSSCCEKESGRRVLGHTMSYWPGRHAFIVFGGVSSADYGRFSKLSSQLWIFLLDTGSWLHLDYKKNGGLLPPGLYPERAFHSAAVVDQYLVIFGGYTHIHNKDESCYSAQLLLYNLECQMFLPTTATDGKMPQPQPPMGLFGHQSTVYKDELWSLGGYRGYLSQAVGKVPFPFTLSRRESSDCRLFDRWRCSGEPKCGWCPTNGKCFDIYSGAANCTTNLQTAQCPGICSLLASCQSCVLPGGCSWCGSLEECWRESEFSSTSTTSTVCNSPMENSAQSDAASCSQRNWRLGATQFEYRFPPNYTNPDSVKIVNSSVLIIGREYGVGAGAGAGDSPMTYALRGSIVGSSFTNPLKKLELCSSQAAVNLSLSTGGESFSQSYRWTDYQLCYNLSWPSGLPVHLVHKQKIRFELVATAFGKGVHQDKAGRVVIQLKVHSGGATASASAPASASSPRILRKDHLLPYEGGRGSGAAHNHCLAYIGCLPCTGDTSCVWRADTGRCIPRLIGLGREGVVVEDKHWIPNPMLELLVNKSLIIQPEDCPLCSDRSNCEECVGVGVLSPECEWWEEEMSCQRRGRLDSAVRKVAHCPSPCSFRGNCSSCLGSGKCVWCEQRQECFAFSVYTSYYQYGQCYQWIDKPELCQRCDKQPSCESCVLNMGCGWTENECTQGGFDKPYKARTVQLQILGNKTKSWTYGDCPDVDECELELAHCHPNATCINTPGSYACFCQKGFTGDGKGSCEQTCEEPCLHGTCSPKFLCECDLGWSGKDCSVDCLCNNHSMCEEGGAGKCDECKDFTTGDRCERCAEASYGNATMSEVGCSPCNCNGHGDVAAGLCDPSTGHCFCLNNTSSAKCDECAEGYYGNPSEGRPCYLSCTGRGLLEGRRGYFGLPSSSHFLISRKKQLHQGSSLQGRNASILLVEHCMWIIKADEDEDPDKGTAPAGILITIEPGFDIPCSQNVLLIHKGYSEYGTSGKTVAAVCNDKEERDKRVTPTHITVEGTVVTVVLKYARMGTTKFSFNGSFKTLSESELVLRTRKNQDALLAKTNLGLTFNISTLYEGTSPSLSVLSRFGHSLHVDQRNLWIFGGYSLSHGPLNDIRHFSRDSNSWVPLTITVLTNEEAVPPARYFHGAVIGPNLVIYVHGGISGNLTFLSDSWEFDTRNSRWRKFCEGPNESPKLAGHTLTLRPGGGGGGGGVHAQGTESDHFSIVMIGGFNPEEGFSDKVYSIGPTECWTEIETSGSSPLGVYGHSTVYHEGTDSFYVYGGTLHDTIGGMQHGPISTSSRLFVLQWESKRWSVLSPMEENQFGPYPTPRFLHTAVSTDEYMVILGGIGGDIGERNSTVLVYVYQCNLWLLIGRYEQQPVAPANANVAIFEEGSSGSNASSRSTLLDPEVSVGRIAGATAVWGNEIFQMGGWRDGETSESLFTLSTPKDACNLQRTKSRCKGTLGCAFCASNNNQSQQCYNAGIEMPSSCSDGASNIEFWKGVPCTPKWLGSQDCGRFNSCTECLAVWPSHPNVQLGCAWCTNGKEGRCIPSGVKDKFEEENSGSPCGQKQWVVTDSSQCPERICSAPQCEKCTAVAGKCIWTRQILRSRERSWELRLQPVYDWNCVRKSILDSSPSVTVVSSPPASCPIPCWHFDSCYECVESGGAEGGFHQCVWAVSQRKCISPAYSPLLCFGGICGPILKGPQSICPKACTTLRSCRICLENPSCGWCGLVDGENGEGVCLSTSAVSEPSGLCSNQSKWYYLKCPAENECTNGHHGCDPQSEQCINLEEGYRCQCREGYERSDTACVPICPDGCVHGQCVEPGRCKCDFGYVGRNCSAQCNCNGHSDCAGTDRLDVCLECKNNTMGPRCAQCQPMFVGDPKNNGACIACSEYCNGHSTICLSRMDYNNWCNGTNGHLSPSQLTSQILASGVQTGPSTTAFCCHCKNQTNGDTCNDCIPGYFRGYDDKRLPCRKCECHGHGNTCDPVTGHSCNCHNNTESEHCTQNTLKQNPHYQCWKHQCSKCREAYLGNPTHGRQCYLQMLMEELYCFDPKTQDNSNSNNGHAPTKSCAIKQKPLLSGRTVYFAVQPKFMNVNIRITFDVTHGAINVYLSPKDDTFIISQDEHSWIHKVEFDTKYGLSGERKESVFGKQGAATFSGNGHVHGGTKGEPDYGDLMAQHSHNNKTEGLLVESVSRIIPKPVGPASLTAFRFIEQEAAGYATYYTVQDSKAVLLVRNLRNRLVITLPQDSHDLRLTRFYLVLEGVGDVSFGSVVFRQDQLHIDLFVFFSVFFSAFFLFLAGCGIAWKVKQNMEARRARHRHVAEMLSMAKRPFAVTTVLLQPDPSSGIAEAYTQCRKSCRKGCICLRPVAVEWTAIQGSGGNTACSPNAVCTMLINLPGGNNAPVKLCIGSVLANLQRSHAPYHARRRRLHH